MIVTDTETFIQLDWAERNKTRCDVIKMQTFMNMMVILFNWKEIRGLGVRVQSWEGERPQSLDSQCWCDIYRLIPWCLHAIVFLYVCCCDILSMNGVRVELCRNMAFNLLVCWSGTTEMPGKRKPLSLEEFESLYYEIESSVTIQAHPLFSDMFCVRLKRCVSVYLNVK